MNAKIANKTTNARNVGRPTLGFKLPSSGKFTAKTILNRLAPAYAKSGKVVPTLVTVHNHIKKAVAAKTVEFVESKQSGTRGRPESVYRSLATK